MSGKPRPQASHWQRFVIHCYLLLCNNLNDILIYLLFFNFTYCESVVICIILLEVARELSRFCKMARRSKVVEPRCHRLPSDHQAEKHFPHVCCSQDLCFWEGMECLARMMISKSRDSQPYFDHMYPFSISTDVHVPLKFHVTKRLSKKTIIHWIFNRTFRNSEL